MRKPRMEPTEPTVQNKVTIVKEPFWKCGWRPALAWGYVAICVFDFIIAPTIMMAFFGQASATTMLPPGLTAIEYVEILKALPVVTYHAWVPLTLAAGGFFHIAMAGILGIGSFTRGKDKQIRAANNVHPG